MKKDFKPIFWVGASKEELLSFPEDALQDAGYQLHRLQQGDEPLDWKPLKHLRKGITGVYEIRIWEDNATYRVAYVTKFGNYVSVLHCWQKTTQTTDQKNRRLIISRYKDAKEKLT